MTSLGLIIWRFQPLHSGHMLLIERSLSENPATLILIGSSNKKDNKNPYSYEERKAFILWEFPKKKLSISPLPDFPDNQDWVDHILLHIPERVTDCYLYCGDRENDYAVQVLESLRDTLPFILHVVEINRKELPISGTLVREYMENQEIWELKDSLWENTFHQINKRN